MKKEICDFIYWLYKNEIVVKNDEDYINALYAEFDIEQKTSKKESE